MVKHVIYSHSMEPLTVLDLSDKVMKELEGIRYVSIRTFKPAPLLPFADNVMRVKTYNVRLTAEWFYRGNKDHMFIFTEDVEEVKLLGASLLSGQLDQYQLRRV